MRAQYISLCSNSGVILRGGRGGVKKAPKPACTLNQLSADGNALCPVAKPTIWKLFILFKDTCSPNARLNLTCPGFGGVSKVYSFIALGASIP